MTSAATNQVVLSLGPVPGLVGERVGASAKVVVLESAELREYQGSLEDVVGLIARGHASVDAAVIGRLPRLKVISRTGAGVDLVDVAAATERGSP